MPARNPVTGDGIEVTPVRRIARKCRGNVLYNSDYIPVILCRPLVFHHPLVLKACFLPCEETVVQIPTAAAK